MRHPLLPVAVIIAVLIIAAESFFGLFSRCLDPMRSASYYGHFVSDSNWMLVDICEPPSHSARSVKAVADVKAISDSSGSYRSCHGKIMLFFQLPADISFGDRLLLRASPERPSAADNPHQFNYRRHLQRKGILFSDYIPAYDYRIVGHSSKGLKHTVNSLRTNIIKIIRSSSLSPSQQGIAEALFLGWDDDLRDSTESDFRRAGITHLLCVSGLHVGIVAMLVGYCLFFLSNKRRDRIIKGFIQLAVIWFFVLLTGMASATLRAALMFSLIVVGKTFFSRPPTLNAIAASAIIILCVNPLTVFDIGFQLSYSAVTGIVLFTGPLENLIPIPEGRSAVSAALCRLLAKMRSLMCVSIVAQLCTAPLTLYYFHQFPLFFLVANMTVVPCAALLLGTILVVLAFSWNPWTLKITSSVLSAELSVTEWITSSIASWPHSMLTDIYFDPAMAIVAMAIVATLGWLLLRGDIRALAASLLLACLLAGHSLAARNSRAAQRHVDFYNVGNHTAIEFFAGNTSYLLCDSAIAANPSAIDYQTANNLLYRMATREHILVIDTSFNDGILFVSNGFVGFNNTSMRIVDRSNYRLRSSFRPKVDYLILRESPYITIDDLRHHYDFDTLVILSQNSTRRRTAWLHQCDSSSVPYIDACNTTPYN